MALTRAVGLVLLRGERSGARISLEAKVGSKGPKRWAAVPPWPLTATGLGSAEKMLNRVVVTCLVACLLALGVGSARDPPLPVLRLSGASRKGWKRPWCSMGGPMDACCRVHRKRVRDPAGGRGGAVVPRVGANRAPCHLYRGAPDFWCATRMRHWVAKGQLALSRLHISCVVPR